jgi:hypothetical protein
MKKIMFSGLPPDVSEERVRSELARFGEVGHVSIIRDGDPDQPIVIVEIALDDDEAFNFAARIKDVWHEGHRINAWVLRH